MTVNLNNNFNDLSWVFFNFLNSYIPKIFSTYFKMKGIKVQDNFLAFEKKYMFHYEFHCPALTLEASAYDKPYTSKERPLIYFLRYYNYPKIDGSYGSTTLFHTPGATLGFVETIIKVIDKKLLPIIQENGEELKKLEDDSRNKFLSQIGTYNPNSVLRENEYEKNKNVSKEFFPKYLDCEHSSVNEIKKQLKLLLAE